MATSLVDTDQATDFSGVEESPEQEQLREQEDSGHQNLERKSSFFQFFVQKNYSHSLSSSNLCSCLQIIISIMTGMLLVLGTMSMTCYSHLKFIPRLVHVDKILELPNKSPANAICKTLHNVFVGNSSSSNERESLNGMLLQGFVIPLFVASVLSSIACILAKQEQRKSSNSSNKQILPGRFRSLFKRDPPLTFLTILLVLMPSLYMAFETHLYPSRSEGGSFYITLFRRLANPAGVAACFALSLFLIPVAKHSPLIEVFGLSFTQALSLHRISGWTSLVFSLIHGCLYILNYGISGDDENGFWSNAILALYPPQRCWDWDIFSLHGQSTAHCYGYWRNFTGVISLLAFAILGITSLPAIRRRAYWLFISVHIPAAWVMMIGAIAHFRFIALFLLPNIVYYLVTTVPVWIQHTTAPVWIQRVRNVRFDQGPNVKSITLIDDSNGCCLLRLRCPESQPHTGVSLDNYGGGLQNMRARDFIGMASIFGHLTFTEY